MKASAFMRVALGASILALVSPIAMPALALDIPKAGPRDARVRWINYDPWQVFRIVGVYRSAVQVEFSPDETIENVALGDTVAWEVAPVGYILFLKPREKNPPTNMTVTTRRPDGSIRSYRFELSARDADVTQDLAGTYFSVTFKYPMDDAAKRREAAQERAAQVNERRARDRLAPSPFYGKRNWAYTVQGRADFEPVEVSDNGQVTVMRFPGNVEIPAIYTVEADGSEALVPTNVEGQLVVIHSVNRALRLRKGSEVLCIYNEKYDPVGVNPSTGTASPDVLRTTKEAR